jgi:hypothetical protein
MVLFSPVSAGVSSYGTGLSAADSKATGIRDCIAMCKNSGPQSDGTPPGGEENMAYGQK